MTATLTNNAELLIAMFDDKRNHAITILDGLTDKELRTSYVPSNWSPLGMIGHLETLERFWFRAVMQGDFDAKSDIEGNIEWQVDPAIPTEAVFASYRAEIARSNEIIRSTPLDAAPVWWPDFFGEFKLETLYEIVLHNMTETSNHAGHLDICREVIDGRQWFVFDD